MLAIGEKNKTEEGMLDNDDEAEEFSGAEILGDKYHGKIPLPIIPMYQATDNTAY